MFGSVFPPCGWFATGERKDILRHDWLESL
jgi:hypothetical protein